MARGPWDRNPGVNLEYPGNLRPGLSQPDLQLYHQRPWDFVNGWTSQEFRTDQDTWASGYPSNDRYPRNDQYLTNGQYIWNDQYHSNGQYPWTRRYPSPPQYPPPLQGFPSTPHSHAAQHHPAPQYCRPHQLYLSPFDPFASQYAKQHQYSVYGRPKSRTPSSPLSQRSKNRSQSVSAKHRSAPSEVTLSPDLSRRYRYEPIDGSKRMIRLIQLFRDKSPEGYLNCQLKHFELAQAPPYITLSYTWRENFNALGDTESFNQAPPFISLSYTRRKKFNALNNMNPTKPRTNIILVDCQPFEIGRNLFTFLDRFRLRLENHDRSQQYGLAWLWIDQLSIDQGNQKEQSHQVRLMTEIYSQSKLTIAWLGMKYSGSLERHPYFSRVWVIQELVLSRKILLLYGMKGSKTWEELVACDYPRGSDEIQRFHNFMGWISFNTGAIEGIRVKYAKSLQGPDGEPGLHLSDALSGHDSLKCGNPKDQIYGLLGLVKRSERPVIDYTKTEQEIFLDAAVKLLNSPPPNHQYYTRDLLISKIGHWMGLIRDLLSLDDPPEHGKPYLGKNLSQFIRLLNDTVDRLSAMPIHRPRKPISKLGFQRVPGGKTVPLWANDRDWKNRPGKWWFEYDGSKYCFAKKRYRLPRPRSGDLVESPGSNPEDYVLCILPKM